MSRLRSWLAPCLSLALAAGCSKPPEEAKPSDTKPGEATETKPGEAVDTKAGESKAGETKLDPPPVAKPEGGDASLAAAVAAMVEAETSYPVALDPLLDLVPAGSPVVVVVRDVDDLLAVTDVALGSIGPALRTIAAAAGGDASTELTRVLEGYGRVQGAVRGPDFAIDKGMVIAGLGQEGVVIYGTRNPEALPTLLRALGAEGDDLPVHCKAVDGAEDYAVCASDAETLGKYAPGQAAAALRGTLGERLGAREIERANVLAHLAQGPDPTEHVTFAMATPPGLVHFTAGLAKVPGELGRILTAGPSPALGMLAPGSGFYWAQLDPAPLTAVVTSENPLAGNVTRTLTGELMLGTLAEPSSLVLLAGVTDPAPAGGLIALAGTQVASLPKTLPDGSSLEVAMETLVVGGKDTQVLHATLTPKGEAAAAFGTMGLAPEAWLFSTGGYAGLAFGADAAVVQKIAAHTGAGPGPDALRALPKPLAQGLVDGEVSLAVHLPIDGLQSPQVAAALEKVATQLPADELPPGVTAAQMFDAAMAVMSPVSGLSMWMAPPKDRMVVHVAVSLVGDARTEEGKAAMAAMAAVAGGGDPAKAWGELATRYAGSDRRTAYEARAGTRSDGALTSAAMLGVIGGLAGAALFAVRAADPMPPAVAVPPAIAVPPPVVSK